MGVNEQTQLRARGGGGGGCSRKGGGGGEGFSEGGRGGGFGWDPPSSQGPPVVPAEGAEGGPKKIFLKRKSSWHRRRRTKILAVSLKHWKGRCGAILIYHWGRGDSWVVT